MFKKLVYTLAVTLLLAANTSSAANYYGVLKSGQKLNPGDNLFSGTSNFVLTLQATDGNLVVYSYPSMGVAWTAPNLAGKGAVAAVMQTDGNFVVYNAANVALWNTGTWGRPGADLYLNDTSELFIFNSVNTSQPMWKSTGNLPVCTNMSASYPFPSCVQGMSQTIWACSTMFAAVYLPSQNGKYGTCQ